MADVQRTQPGVDLLMCTRTRPATVLTGCRARTGERATSHAQGATTHIRVLYNLIVAGDRRPGGEHFTNVRTVPNTNNYRLLTLAYIQTIHCRAP